MGPTLRYAALAAPVANLGPGHRAALWVQGCPLACPGCTAPDWQPEAGGRMEPVSRIAHRLLARDRDARLAGLTLSGGEPLLQAEALLALWRRLQVDRPAWTLVLFTGFRGGEVARRLPASARELFEAADLAVTGRYVAPLDDGRGLRGSTNQELLIRKASWHPLGADLEQAPRASLELHPDGADSLVVGIPPGRGHAGPMAALKELSVR